jgi:hypothetical protein
MLREVPLDGSFTKLVGAHADQHNSDNWCRRQYFCTKLRADFNSPRYWNSVY